MTRGELLRQNYMLEYESSDLGTFGDGSLE